MHDQALIWNTDANLEVTSYTARLRELAGIGDVPGRIAVSDLWREDLPYSVPVLAHRWALEGECVSFEAPALGTTYRFDLQPLYSPNGEVIGVSGCAVAVADPDTGQLSPHVYAAAERHAGVGIWHQDLRTGRTTISSGLATLLGIDPAAPFDIRSFDHPEDRTEIARVLSDPDASERYSCDHRVCFGEGRVRAVRERLDTVFDQRGMAVARIGSLVDVSDLKERVDELTDLALCDPLTRLANRALLLERMTAAVARTARYGTLSAVLFIDLDGFKNVNDTLGHDAGDRLLRELSDHLQSHFRPTDTIGRLGGDEFVVLVEDLYSEEAAVSAAQKLLNSLSRLFAIGPHKVAIGASIGVAVIPRCSTDPEELLAMADREMYAVKRSGGGGVKLVACAPVREPPPPSNRMQTA
ncbi:MAG TPA: sensor domain-containing diguanylate cyclase [Candidatus Baltobacteraceae bacterium]|nr:sensor domain-containing diguanylate cyclase [Candidatus Baltobacteraceae bacterium]